MRVITYLIYIVLFEGLVWCGTGYAVFVLDRSGWWFVLAILIAGAAYPPERWIDGKKL
jgi:hypothetical protein